MHLCFRKNTILLSVILIIFPIACIAADIDSATLFIHSDPINASIIIDGTPVIQKTPALIVGIDSGIHLVQIRKEGFAPADFDIVLEKNSTSVLEADLSNHILVTDFPDNKNVFLRTAEDIKKSQTLRLTEGSYNFIKDNGSLYITPVYPKENLLTLTGTLFVTALTASAITAAVEIKNNGELFLPHSELLVISETLTAVLGLSTLALHIDQHRFISSFELYEADLSRLDAEAEQLFQKAQDALSTGRIEEALSSFSELIGNYPDYSEFPEALYKTSRLHIISGDTNLAVSELKIIISNYPDAGIYDKACQTLSLLYYNSGEIDNSRKTAEMMTYIDPIFSDTEEEIIKIGIDQVIENWARNPSEKGE